MYTYSFSLLVWVPYCAGSVCNIHHTKTITGPLIASLLLETHAIRLVVQSVEKMLCILVLRDQYVHIFGTWSLIRRGKGLNFKRKWNFRILEILNDVLKPHLVRRQSRFKVHEILAISLPLYGWDPQEDTVF